MLISAKSKLAFLALPKTGTTALEQILAPFCDIHFGKRPDIKHLNMKEYERFILPYLRKRDLADTETFCVVREPIDWLGSWYRYRRRKHLDGSPKSTKGVSFAEFIEGYLSKPQKDFARQGSIAGFVTGYSGEPSVTHLFRYESMDGVVKFLGERFRKKIELPTVNVSPKMEIELPKALRTRLETERALDFEIYANLAK